MLSIAQANVALFKVAPSTHLLFSFLDRKVVFMLLLAFVFPNIHPSVTSISNILHCMLVIPFDHVTFHVLVLVLADIWLLENHSTSTLHCLFCSNKPFALCVLTDIAESLGKNPVCERAEEGVWYVLGSLNVFAVCRGQSLCFQLVLRLLELLSAAAKRRCERSAIVAEISMSNAASLPSRVTASASSGLTSRMTTEPPFELEANDQSIYRPLALRPKLPRILCFRS